MAATTGSTSISTRTVRVEVGLILTNASTLSSLLELLLQTSSAPATSIESQTTYRRAFRAAAARKWQLTPTPATTTRDERPHPEESKFFRLISPGLDNEQHYNRCAAFLKQVEAGASTSSAVQLNPTTGLRVHVDVTGLSCEGLKRVCQNYVKYEAAIDSFLPPSRRTGSPASQRYFQSIRQATALHRIATTNKERNDAIGSCENMESLLLLLNPQGSNYKLNIRNVTPHHVLEFRSHSSTSNRKKIVAWIALCSAIVATADGKRPAALKESRGLDEEFDALFKNVVKMPSLREYYKERRVELAVASNTTKRTVAKRADEESVPKKVKVPKNQDCGCCFETVSTSTMCPCQARNHWFCQTCVRKHAETQLFSNLSSKMQCLSMDGCKSHLNTIHLKRALSKKVKAKLSEVQYLENVEQNKKVASTCPKCKKSTVILPKKETFFSCPLASCAHEWCRLCNQAPHETLLCSEAARRKQVTNARTSVEEDMTGAYVRRCPQCQVAFVRESGCNKMTCPNRGCGTMSCYICRQVIQGVDHFSVSGCSLYTNSGAGDWTDRRLVQQAGDTTARRVMREIGTANEELKVNLVTPYWEDTRHMHFVWSTRSFVFVALFCKCKCQQDVAVSFHRAAVTETPPPSFLLQLLTTGARRIPRPCSQAHQLSSSERYSQGLWVPSRRHRKFVRVNVASVVR